VGANRGGMRAPLITAIYLLVTIGAIVGVDVFVFRHHFWERLAANVGIVLLAGAFYFRFLKGP
jgi:cytochrome c oxidase subunit IV